jgi:hypothetical protein
MNDFADKDTARYQSVAIVLNKSREKAGDSFFACVSITFVTVPAVAGPH